MADIEWKMARRWVISTGVNLKNRRIQSCEDLCDFAVSLRDGTILCAIANVMKPHSVEYSKRKIMNEDKHEFLCKRNIALFLAACRDSFNVNPKDLFTRNDLYDLSNIGAVVKTLSVLSHHKKALDIEGCRPFSVVEIENVDIEDGHIYRSLSEKIDKEELFTEDMYEDEHYYDSEYNSLIYSTSLPVNKNSPTLNARPSKREYIIKELLETEESYIRHMSKIVEVYIPALKQLVTPEDKASVFLNIKQIYRLHLSFYRDLCNATSSNGSASEIDISVFSRYKENFLIYAHYCAHLEESQKRFDQLLKEPEFRNKVEELSQNQKHLVPLKGQLCLCFQRVLKYKLILAELLKSTPNEHEEHHIIEMALAATKDVTNYINEFMRDYDAVCEINHIQSTLKFYSVAGDMENFRVSFGRHLHDGEVQLQFQGREKREKRVMFLFEQALLLCKSNGESNEVYDILGLDKLSVKDFQTSLKGKLSQVQCKFSHCFALSILMENNGVDRIHTCHIFTKTEKLKKSWKGAIQKCIQDTTLQVYDGKLNNHVFRLTTFDSSNYYTCDVCQKLLVGQISQGCICENGDCQVIIHAQCLQSSPPCQYHKSESETESPATRRRRKCVPRDQRRKTVDELIALTVNRSMGTVAAKEPLPVSLSRHLSLEDFRWFSGRMSRDESEDMLQNRLEKPFPNGSFLIRENREGVMVLSVKWNDNCFHIKIREEFGQFYLSEAQRFASIEETISYYQTNSLRNCKLIEGRTDDLKDVIEVRDATEIDVPVPEYNTCDIFWLRVLCCGSMDGQS